MDFGMFRAALSLVLYIVCLCLGCLLSFSGMELSVDFSTLEFESFASLIE